MSTLSKNHHPNFNSRLREETNILCDGYLQLGSIFQLTSPQGDEHKSLVAVLINQLNFNSRLRKETNLDKRRLSLYKIGFQLTSP